MVVGELFLSAFLQVLFDRLASRELLDFLLQEGLHDKLKKWEHNLKMVQAVLDDAEEKQLTDRAVKMWLDDLQDLAYDVEDILDEFATEALSRKLKMQQQHHQVASSSKVRKLIPARLSNWSPSSIQSSSRLKSEIEDITSRLEGLYEQRLGLGLQTNVGMISTSKQQRPPSSSVPPEPAIYGRDEDKARLLEMVMKDEPDADNSDANFRVISIFAMGGAGKTTLAREVFNDEAVEDFNLRVWVCVSDEFDVLGTSKAILESITCSPCNLKTLNEVQVQLKNQVAGKKFLLVLDDVWNEDYGLWQILKSPFLGGAKGSTMIVTTRLEDVALKMGGHIDCYKLNLLSKDDCWSLFKKHACESEVIGAHQGLESIRTKVVEKCQGLPLVAQTLGGLLRCKPRSDWEDILNSKIWNLSSENDILPVLKLSYHHLPSHLKRCFAYCAIFPKNYEFEEKELVFLWMAEDLVQPSEDNKQLEDIGWEYFYDLLSRSIFQRSITSNTKFIMHDLINDLAQSVSGDTYFRLESLLKLNKQSKILERFRHASYICGVYDNKQKLEVFHEVKLIRTFLPIFIEHMYERYRQDNIYITSYVLNLLPKFKRLRALSLRKYYITQLPDLGDLRHLRYLNLAGTMIISLPKSTSLLFNLQTLILRDCRLLKTLPSKMRNLINLRHLDIKGVNLKEMPVGMKDLKNLCMLSNFVVGKKSGCDLNDLKYLIFLSEELHISRLENASSLLNTKEAILGDKDGLTVLHLEWGSHIDDLRKEEEEETVLGILRPHKNLKELSMKLFGGRRFPSWVADPSFSNVTVIRLENCFNCTVLPSLGLLSSLKDLTIKGMSKLKSISSEIYGGDCSFQALEILCLEDLQELEYWNHMEENEQHVTRFPCLQELSIVKCSKLSGKLPNHLPSLEKLVIRECQQMTISFAVLRKLCELEIDGCKGMTCSSMMDYELLKSMNLSQCSEFGNWLSQGFQKVGHLKIVGCTELILLWQNVISLEQPPKGFQSFTSLRELYIEGCNALTSLPEGLKHNIAHLQCLQIKGCDSITSIVTDHLPSSLKQLNIENCKKLQYLEHHKADTCTSSLSSSSAIHMESIDDRSLSLLEQLSISHCSSLTCIILKGQFPASLKSLKITNCSELTILSPMGQLPEALEVLEIESCQKLESIVDWFFNNTSLKYIHFWSCENLKSIPQGLQNLSHLSDFQIVGCPSLVSFPEGELPKTNLEFLVIESCEQLSVLPNHLHNINSLQTLYIKRCPSITSFVQEGFPTNLTTLCVEGLNIYKPLVEWGLHNLTSLARLTIDGCTEAKSFPQEEIGMMLPLSLKRLRILRFPKLKHLFPNGFQNLISLEYLRIQDCPKLTSFPEVGLPSSLLELRIVGCPLLQKHCKRDKGREWSKIADIPRVEIDRKFIYDP